MHVHVAWIITFQLHRQPLKEIKQPHHTQPQAVEEPDAGDTKPLTEEEKRQKVCELDIIPMEKYLSTHMYVHVHV